MHVLYLSCDSVCLCPVLPVTEPEQRHAVSVLIRQAYLVSCIKLHIKKPLNMYPEYIGRKGRVAGWESTDV